MCVNVIFNLERFYLPGLSIFGSLMNGSNNATARSAISVVTTEPSCSFRHDSNGQRPVIAPMMHSLVSGKMCLR